MAMTPPPHSLEFCYLLLKDITTLKRGPPNSWPYPGPTPLTPSPLPPPLWPHPTDPFPSAPTPLAPPPLAPPHCPYLCPHPSGPSPFGPPPLTHLIEGHYTRDHPFLIRRGCVGQLGRRLWGAWLVYLHDQSDGEVGPDCHLCRCDRTDSGKELVCRRTEEGQQW